MSVSAGLVGMIMLLSRFFDGFSDLAIGVIMDKVHSSTDADVPGYSG